MTTLTWSDGHWLNPPAAVEEKDGTLLVTAVEKSDAWRRTGYGFTVDTAHALLAPLAQDSAMEVDLTAAFTENFDQAGIMVRVDAENWVKAGVEFSDGACQLGAVVTAGSSDWSVGPVPDWQGKRVRIRVSRKGDALTMRAGLIAPDGTAALRMVRLLPFPEDAVAEAGPFLCAPSRAGLTVPFHAWRVTEADASLH
ncbi:DUF1349 domain-containing protein [Actinomyces sp. MRS3W]|uniref:DUF1349 domain-containing protein n=1 Tax=Actinomyces sp. MRS3W TaxID=2800796 RepID=UPI0028FD9570|nr:DUF1349 domain-containing protein [Actinomyces sp. MRS3W]MDU0348628.1 DUF1349 domain-containing protein [Actinomyces sp. MRS3W]